MLYKMLIGDHFPGSKKKLLFLPQKWQDSVYYVYQSVLIKKLNWIVGMLTSCWYAFQLRASISDPARPHLNGMHLYH